MGEGGAGATAPDITVDTNFLNSSLTNLKDAFGDVVPVVATAIVGVIGVMLLIYAVKFAWRWIKGLLGR